MRALLALRIVLGSAVAGCAGHTACEASTDGAESATCSTLAAPLAATRTMDDATPPP